MKILTKTKVEEAFFAAGCFWSVELTFSQMQGVVATRVGYMGGATKKPTYQEVCGGTTGHAESVKIVYDPTKVSYERLLDVFWKLHDPTQLNRQGSDVGSQYRSVIFYSTSKQKKLAEDSKIKEQEKLRKKIVTEIVPAGVFYDAEEYHQQYLKKKGMGTCPLR